MKANEISREMWFSVVYGSVRAKDIKTSITTGFQTTREMRTAKFTAWDRLILSPRKYVGCGCCEEVCPHGVFAAAESKARIVDLNPYME
jgi:ferredoxin